MRTPQKPKILFLAPYPFGRVGSQRFRFEQYWDILSSENELSFQPFLSDEYFNILYQKGKTFQKLLAVGTGYLNRFRILAQIPSHDLVFIHREATPIGPPIFEWLIAKVFRKKIIYDYDDAIWLPNTTAENKLASALKCHWKVAHICKWSWKISCGNEFLAKYASQFCQNTYYIPTTLDTSQIPQKENQLAKVVTIGWTGTHSTLKYLNSVLPVLQELELKFEFNFIVIADKNPRLPLKNYQFIPWKKETEWYDLAKIDIGIMPLENTEWEEGKCGFKALQYMAIGIPALASPTRANEKIIENGQNGFICQTQSDWKTNLEGLLNEKNFKYSISKKGRKTIENEFSKKTWTKNYLELVSLGSGK